eukprot:maker-scaffold_37-snap-gene-2.0-mRNA-1 protein AED:0.02 eAED:0.02 QI:116/1/1/1/0.66/0.5/4/386/401
MKLYTKPASYTAQKVLIAAEYASINITPVTEVTDKKIKELSALATLPVLETPEGTLVNSNAISQYVSLKSSSPEKLLGSTPFQKAQIQSWIEFSGNEVEVPAVVSTYSLIGWMKMSQVPFEKARKDLNKAMSTLESHLKSRTFLVGEGISLADITLAAALVLPFKVLFDAKNRKTFTSVTRWFKTCVNQPEFKAVLGNEQLCVKSLAPAGSQKSAPKSKKKVEKKAEKKAAPAPPAPKKKEKHYAELLPKPTMVLDEWKRQYSNAGDDCYKVMPWFWENLDYNGYSIFFADYKYADELEVEFMISNLVGGFVQRCDEIRKYAFGTLQILKAKDGNKFQIKGAWLFRGDSEKMMLDANPDGETYEWVKADLKSEVDKKKIEDLWCAWEEIDGMLITDCKVFK